jgi:hypothetical protein
MHLRFREISRGPVRTFLENNGINEMIPSDRVHTRLWSRIIITWSVLKQQMEICGFTATTGSQ